MGEFDKWLDTALHDKRIEQKELARRLGVNESQISRWRSGINNPRPDTIRKIAKALDTSYPYLSHPDSTISEAREEESEYNVSTSNTIDQKLQELQIVMRLQGRLSVESPGYLDAVLASVGVLKELAAELEELVQRLQSQNSR